jgi:hypothetical protein
MSQIASLLPTGNILLDLDAGPSPATAPAGTYALQGMPSGPMAVR